MKRTWKLTAAGILCIIVGAVFVVPGIAFAVFFAFYGAGWLDAIGGLTLIILGIMPIVGGIYALRRRRLGLALAGSVSTLLNCLILGILAYIAVTADNYDVKPGDLIPLVVGVTILAIPGILAIIFVNRGKREFEAHEFNKAIELNPDNADAYYKRGDAYSEIGDYDKAIADYNEAIELNPSDALAYFNRGYAYGEIGDYEKAIVDYSKAIELNPSDALAYYNRGLDYHNKGEVLKAVSDLEKCIGLSTDPEVTEAAQQALREAKKSP